MSANRHFPIGAELFHAGAHFRVWAPARRKVTVQLEPNLSQATQVSLQPEAGGYFAGWAPKLSAGTCYRFRLDDGDPVPDPASRFQPKGPSGPSQLVDPSIFTWTDANWKGKSIEGQVLYELHVGTFTPEGTWEAATHELAELKAIGISLIEVMPIADFTGRFGWGYDGVGLFAPVAVYGQPDDFRRFVNEAHKLGMGVLLDVVYNHFGPEGNYLKEFSPNYFSSRYTTDWGEALNFDGDNCAPVREFFLTNATYWIEEFHLDGLRLDATQQIFDSSPDHILKEITLAVRTAARGRATIVVAENEPQQSRLARPIEQGGYGIDCLWNDDFHHSAAVALTGHNEAYYTDYKGTPQEFISAVKYGYLYQGQRYKWQKKRRGSPAFGLRPAQFVTFIQNHDQVANSGRGLRVSELTSSGKHRALTALLLLAPGTPMLFQGQEFAASTPFFYFADHSAETAKLVREGRAGSLAQFRSLKTSEMRSLFTDPGSIETFQKSKLDFKDRQRNATFYYMVKELIAMRRRDQAFRTQISGALDGAVLGDDAFVLRFFVKDKQDRLLVVNLGLDLHLDPAPEPLLAPPEGCRWTLRWSSEDPRFGGHGTYPLDSEENWRIPGHAAVVLQPEKHQDED
jgi:maltooligosyltrehalose trehalohydrolase